MRILIVHNILWAHYKASIFQSLQRLVDRQPDVTVRVLQIARNERSRAGLEASVDTSVTAATAVQTVAPTYTYEYDLLFDRYLEDVSLRERARELLKRARAFRPDVINLTGYYDPAQLLLLLWANANGIRVVMQNESTAADQQRGGWKERFKRWLFGRCDGFFCFGNQSANYLIHLGVPPEKILLRKNAVDNNTIRAVYERALPNRAIQQQALGLRPRNFVFVGRLIPVKNLPALLSAFANAQGQSPNGADWGLILLGDGAERDALTAQANALGLAKAIQLLPGRPWFQVPGVLALSDVLVLPSRSEPWGLVVNEAMTCGLPVIVSDRCGCVPDLVHDGQNGFVFKLDDNSPGRSAGTVDSPRVDSPDQLVRLLVAFIDDAVNTSQLGQVAQQTVASYSPDVVAQEMLAGFRQVVSGKPQPVSLNDLSHSHS